MAQMSNEDLNLFLSLLKEATGEMRWKNGDCYRLYKMLRALLPEVVARYDQINCHVYTLHNGLLWDIAGACSLDEVKTIPLEGEPEIWLQAQSWRYCE